MRNTTTTTHTHKGAGLARGPAFILGTILAGLGLALFLKNGMTPTGGFPDGDINGPTVLGVETNGWTAWITTAAGVLLLIGAAQHLLAKAMSAIVGIALLACAVIGLVDGDVLGIAATNHWTELGWGIAGALALLTAFAPRRRHRDDVVDHRDIDDRRVVTRDEPTAVSPATRTTTGPAVTREPVAGETVRRDETYARDEVPAEDLNRRDVGTETERTETVRVGDPRADQVVEGQDVGRKSSRFRRS
jgi:hypothetical protein